MIKRLIGLLLAAAVIGIIILAILRQDEFHSMLPWDNAAPAMAPVKTQPSARTTTPTPVSAPAPVDSVAMPVPESR